MRSAQVAVSAKSPLCVFCRTLTGAREKPDSPLIRFREFVTAVAERPLRCLRDFRLRRMGPGVEGGYRPWGHGVQLDTRYAGSGARGCHDNP